MEYKKKKTFENGYTLSVICVSGRTSGAEEGLFEAAIIGQDGKIIEVISDCGFLEIAKIAIEVSKMK